MLRCAFGGLWNTRFFKPAVRGPLFSQKKAWRFELCFALLCLAWRGFAWLGLAWLGLAWLGLAEVCWAQLCSLLPYRLTFSRPAICLHIHTCVYKTQVILAITRLTFTEKYWRPTLSRPAVCLYIHSFVYKTQVLLDISSLTFVSVHIWLEFNSFNLPQAWGCLKGPNPKMSIQKFKISLHNYKWVSNTQKWVSKIQKWASQNQKWVSKIKNAAKQTRFFFQCTVRGPLFSVKF